MTTQATRAAQPRVQGRISRAIARKRVVVLRTGAPYAAGFGSPALAGVVLDKPLVTGLALGAAAATAGIRLHEAHGWHRSGGKAAIRRRRRYQGWATSGDIRRLRRAGPDRDSTLLALGTARHTAVAVHRENSVLYIGPPGYGKTAALACHAADAPGALFATSTKTELLLDTVNYRPGRIWILNADGYGNIPGTLSWSPLDGCRNPQTAIRRAGDFAQASPKEGKTGGDYWAGMGAGLITVMLHAAAVSGATMREVTAWVRNPWAPDVKDAYTRPGADLMLATKLASLIGGEGEHLNGIIGAAEAALAWMDDPVMAEAACPPPGEGFSPREFARSRDSAYLIGRKRPYGSVGPYFAALGAEVFEQLRRHALETPAGRLPVPATFVLDEMPLTCPMAVHDMLADARGYRITIIGAAQADTQLKSMAGENDGGTIRSASPVEVIFGGEKQAEVLDALSKVIGSTDTWHHVKGSDGSKVRLPDREPLMPPEALRKLARRKAVILAPECRPVLAATPAIWERPGHVRADLSAVFPVPQQQPLALEAGRREAIPMPAGRAPVTVTQPAAEIPVTVPNMPEEAPAWQSS
jgi:type IV secretion system protein VirD4